MPAEVSPEDFHTGGDHRNHNHAQNYDSEIVLHIGEAAEEVAGENDEQNPHGPTNYRVNDEFAKTHGRHACHERSERADNRQIPRKQDRFCTVPFVERVRLLEVFAAEDSRVWVFKQGAAERVADPVIEKVPEKRCDRQQDDDEEQIEMGSGRGESTQSEKESVSREKGRKNNPALGENDQKQQKISPTPKLARQIIKVFIKMKQKVE
jgi:hypothetical protein